MTSPMTQSSPTSTSRRVDIEISRPRCVPRSRDGPLVGATMTVTLLTETPTGVTLSVACLATRTWAARCRPVAVALALRSGVMPTAPTGRGRSSSDRSDTRCTTPVSRTG